MACKSHAHLVAQDLTASCRSPWNDQQGSEIPFHTVTGLLDFVDVLQSKTCHSAEESQHRSVRRDCMLVIRPIRLKNTQHTRKDFVRVNTVTRLGPTVFGYLSTGTPKLLPSRANLPYLSDTCTTLSYILRAPQTSFVPSRSWCPLINQHGEREACSLRRSKSPLYAPYLVPYTARC